MDNLYFSADNGRVMIDISLVEYAHERLKVHPLFLMIAQPVYRLLRGVINHTMTAIVVEEALLATITNCSLYSLFKKKKLNTQNAFLLTMIYAFSFSTMLFVSIPETYVFSSFFLVHYILFIVSVSEKRERMNKRELFLLVLFGVMNFGVTLTNYVAYIAGLVYLLIKKYDLRESLKKFFLINVMNFLFIGLSCVFQKMVWKASTVFITSVIQGIKGEGYEETMYMTWNVSIEKTILWFKETIFYPFLSPTVHLYHTSYGTHVSRFGGYGIICKVFITMFILIAAIAILAGLIVICKEKNSDIGFYMTLCVLLGFNLGMHYFYGYDDAFLYSQNFLYLIVLLLALCLDKMKSKWFGRWIFKFLKIFLVFEILNNIFRFRETARLVLSSYQIEIPLRIVCLQTGFIVMLFLAVYAIFQKIREKHLHLFTKRDTDCTVKTMSTLGIIYLVITFVVGMFIYFNY